MDTERPFPELDAAPAAGTALAEQPASELNLETFDLKKVALAYYGPWREKVADVTKTLTGVVHDVTTASKIAEVKSLRHRLINVPLAAARATEDALKKKLNGTKADVTAELASIEAGYAAAAKLITPQIEAGEAKLAEEKRIAAEKEAARVQAHRDALAKLAAPAERAAAPDMTADRIAKGIELVEAIVIDRDAWEDFADQAVKQKADTLERMRALHGKAVAAEAEAKRQADEKAEAERLAAANKAEADRLAALAADLARQQAELQAAKDKAAAEAKAREDAERAQAEAKAKKDREDAAFESWLASASPSGDVEDVQRQWEASPEYHELHGLQYTAPITQEQDSPQVLKAEASTPDATARETPAITSPSVGSMGAGQTADAAPSVAPAPEVRAFVAPAADAPTLTVGQINERIAPVSLNAEGIKSFGFKSQLRKGAGVHFLASDFDEICTAAANHLLKQAGQKKAA